MYSPYNLQSRPSLRDTMILQQNTYKNQQTAVMSVTPGLTKKIASGEWNHSLRHKLFLPASSAAAVFPPMPAKKTVCCVFFRTTKQYTGKKLFRAEIFPG
jgi:hypothetical protein